MANSCALSAITINRSLEVVRTILNRAARSYRDADGRPWLEAMPRLITMLPETPRSPYPITWKEQDTLFLSYLPISAAWRYLVSTRAYATAIYAAYSGRGRSPYRQRNAVPTLVRIRELTIGPGKA